MEQLGEGLVPIILLIALGAALFRWSFITAKVRDGMDEFTYWVALPSLFVHSLADTDFARLETIDVVVVLALATVVGAVLAAVFAALLRLSGDQFGVFVQVGFRGNMAFVGLPLIIFSLGADNEQLVTGALVALAAMVPLNNLIAVMALVISGEKITWSTTRQIAVKILTNPLILSAVFGAAVGLLGWSLPTMVDRPLELLGQTALALALVSLGGALIQMEARGRIGLSVAASIFKVGAVPLVALGLAAFWGLSGDEMFILLVFAACPSATASFVMTTQLGGDDALAAASIVVSTVLSLPALAVVLIFF